MASVWFSSLISHALFGLDRLVKTFRISTTFEHTPGELVDNLDFVIDQEVFDVEVVKRFGFEGDVEMVDKVDGGVIVHVLDTEDRLDPRHPFFGGDHLSFAFVDSRNARQDVERLTMFAKSVYHLALSPTTPEMINGVRASSMRIESASSTMAKWCPRCTIASVRIAMLSRK